MTRQEPNKEWFLGKGGVIHKDHIGYRHPSRNSHWRVVDSEFDYKAVYKQELCSSRHWSFRKTQVRYGSGAFGIGRPICWFSMLQVRFPADTIARLKSGSINLGTLTAALSSKAASRVAIAPDGRSVAIGGRDKAIRIVELATGRQLGMLLGHTDDVTSLAFTPDGRTPSSGSYDTVREWDIAANRSTAVIPLNAPFYDLAISADGRQLVVTLADDTFLTYSTQSINSLGS